MKARNRKGYTCLGVASGDGVRPVARFQCTKCPAFCDVTLGERENGEALANSAKHQGWIVDAFTAGRTLCPACKGAKMPNDVDSELVAFARKGGPQLAAVTPELPREPTGAERLAIRNALDRAFDSDEGCYLDGQSDQSIGAALDLPWELVRRAREGAYGPIKITAADLALRADLAALSPQLAKQAADIDAAVLICEQLRIEHNRLAAELAALSARAAKGRAA